MEHNLSTRGTQPTSSFGQRTEPFGVAAWALWFYILIAVGRFGELIPGLTAVPLAKIAISISLLALFGEKKRYEKTAWAQSGIIGSATALFLIGGLLVPLSVQVGATLRFMLSTALPMAVAFYTINRICVSWRHIRMTVGALLLSGVILASFAIAKGGDRVSAGSSYDTNDLAYVLVTCLPISIGLAASARGKKRIFLILASILMLVAALLTQSRGGLMGGFAATLYLILRPYTGKSRSILKTVLVGAVIATAGCGIYLTLPQEVQRRFDTLGSLESDYNLEENNLTGRMSIWKRGTQATLDRPIGYGGLTFPQVDLMHGGKYMAPHNSFLQIAVELGLLGLIILLRLYYLSWRTMLTLKVHASRGIDDLSPGESRDLISLSVGVRAALLANMIAGFFLSQAYSSLMWTLFAVSAATATLVANSSNSGRAVTAPTRARQ